MAYEQTKLDGTLKTSHHVGNISSVNWNDIPNGVKASEDVDNFVLGEVFFENGERKLKNATADTKARDAVLVAAVNEGLTNFQSYPGLDAFYNGEGEMTRVVHLHKGLQFITSAFKEGLKNGEEVAFDGKLFDKIPAEGAPEVTLVVVADVDSANYSDLAGKKTVRLEVL